MTRMAWGAGFTTEAADGTTLDAWFRWLGWGELGTGLREEIAELMAHHLRVPERPPVG